MPEINLSSLNGRDLRQLLDASRRRGDAALSYKILQEMAVRREHPAERGPFMMLRPTEPRLTAAALDDSIEEDDDDDLPPLPNWRPPSHEPEVAAAAALEPETPPAPAPGRSQRKTPAARTAASAATAAGPPREPNRPLSLRDAEPDPLQDEAAAADDLGLRFRPAEPETPRAPRPSRPSRPRIVAAFALGIAVGIALGWWGNRIVRDVLSSPLAVAPIRTAALEPRPAPAPSLPAPSPAKPPAQAVADPAGGPLAAELNATPEPVPAPPSPPAAQEPAAEPESPVAELTPPTPHKAEAAKTPETTQPAPDKSAPAATKGCATAPTPADRQICGDPNLRRLQRDLQKAYAEALDAHEDRALLRQRQLAWRDARNTVTDPDRLTQLYEERIRKLNAATAAALKEK